MRGAVNIMRTYQQQHGCFIGTSASASPHAVTQIGSTHYHYNARGELERNHDATSPHNNRWFGYDGQHNLTLVLVGTIENPSAELHLRYGPGGERYRREERVGSHTTLTRYVGSVEYITRPNGIIETKRYIGDVMIETRFSTGAATSKRYLYQDGLGSIDVIANRDGSTPERLSFDGHGNRRNSEDWRSQLLSYTPHTTTHGFTGHEHLDPFRLIHMNGRVYDPQMGRFIQADPVLDAGIQGLNRYSYALNNPLTFTDPSGYSSWNRWLRTIAALVITYYTGGAASSLYAAGNTAGAFAVAAAGGFAAGAVQTGSVKGGLYGAFGVVAFFGVGNAFSQANSGWAYNSSGQLNTIGRVAKTVSHGFVGGVMSGLQGGKFGHGFVAAGATQAVSPQIENLNSAPARTIASATLGGTVSAITGGKFANGAVTAAFSQTFNDYIHSAAKRAAEKRLLLANARMLMKGGMRPFESADDAAIFWHKTVGDLPQEVEFGSYIFKSGDSYYLGPVGSSFNTNTILWEDLGSTNPGYGMGVIGLIHSHPEGTKHSGWGTFVRSGYAGLALGDPVYVEDGFNGFGDLSTAWTKGYSNSYISNKNFLIGWSQGRFMGSSPYEGRYYLRKGAYCVIGSCGL